MPAPLGTLEESRAALDSGATSSRTLVDAALARAEALQPQLNAFIGKVRVADLELRDAPDFWGPLADDLSSAGC